MTTFVLVIAAFVFGYVLHGVIYDELLALGKQAKAEAARTVAEIEAKLKKSI